MILSREVVRRGFGGVIFEGTSFFVVLKGSHNLEGFLKKDPPHFDVNTGHAPSLKESRKEFGEVALTPFRER